MARFSEDIQRLYRGCMIGLCLLGGGFTPEAIAGNVTEFLATIGFEGSCTIDVPATVTFNNFNTVMPNQIESGDENATKKATDVTLSNCSGIGLTPKVTVSGNVNSSYGMNLFRDAASTSVGYGIWLTSAGSDYFQANDNLATNNTIAAIKNWDTSTSLNKINGNIRLFATLTCGSCASEGRIGGNLKAAVTFNFAYD